MIRDKAPLLIILNFFFCSSLYWMPASTRNSSAMLSAGRSTSRSSSEEVIQKINSSKITSETKEIFKLFLTLFSSLQLERDSTISTLNEKVSALELGNGEVSVT